MICSPNVTLYHCSIAEKREIIKNWKVQLVFSQDIHPPVFDQSFLVKYAGVAFAPCVFADKPRLQ